MTLDLSRIAQDLQIRKVQVENVVQLLDEGNTVPFITRYRKERTGGLNEEIIRQVQARVGQQRQLAERKQTILKSIEGQGKLTDELRAAVLAADTPKRLEDLYLPYKPKKRTQATVAREKGLEPLALAVWNRDPAVANLGEILPTMVNPEKELATPEDVLTGVKHILAEQVAETAAVRAAVRMVVWDTAKLVTAKSEKLGENQGLEYKDYFQFGEPVRHIPPHRILAINRGEKENALKVHLEWNAEAAQRAALDKLPLADHPHAEFLRTVAEDALARLLLPSLEREVRRELTERAESHAVGIFARNLRSLLLQPPLRGKRVLAIDPGYRTGCKVAALDETGTLLEDGVIYPHPLHHKHHGKKNGSAGQQPPAAVAAAPAAPPAVTAAPTAATSETPLATEPKAEAPAENVAPPQPAEAAPAPPPAEATPAPAAEARREEPAPAPAQNHKRKEAKARLAELIRKHQTSVIAIGNGTACRETEEFVAEVIADLERRRTDLGTRGADAPAARPGADTPTAADSGAVPATADGAGQAAASVPAMPAEATTSAETTPPAVAAPAGDAASSELAAVAAAETATAPPPPAALPARPADLPEAPADLAYVIVNEAGASVYSASTIGREEFPTFDATLRGTISIGRRLQDPLSELVKIDPQSIGVGLYQHDVNPRHLKESLESVIESSVNQVGVDLNTASVPLLRHVSGLNQLVARELIEYRKQHGPFKNREELLQVPGVGPARFVQAAGFLKIDTGENPLDRTWIHPESYPAARQLLSELGYGLESLGDRQKTEELREKLKGLSPEEVAARLQVGVPTVRDILEALARPGRDPREDLPPPIFRKGILKLEDLQPGMELKGTVLNVVDFGAFVDIGLKDSGLVHISQMANRYIKSPYDVLSVNDVVTVWVLSVDRDRRRVSLTMIQPGTERKPPEKRPPQPRPQQQQQPRGHRPPRGGRRPGPPPGQVATPGRQEGAAATAVAAPAQGPPPRPAPPPRKPQRQPPKPKLTKAALEGEAPLRTFNELKAFFEAKKKDDAPPANP